MQKPRIGFIGLGLMGSAMVERLQSLGYELMVKGNRSRVKIDEALTRGAVESVSAKELAEKVDIVMFCVDNSASVESNIYGESGILFGVKAGTIVIDFGTSLPASTLKISADLAEKGAFYLDCPLGRTPSHAKNGKLNIMGAGEEKIFHQLKPILEDLGENVFYLGSSGTGNKIKLLNNFFAMTTACAMAEVFAMADAAGVPRDKVYQAMSAGPLRSGMMDFIRNYAIDGKIDLAFSVDNAAKDINYYVQMANDLERTSRMAVAAQSTLAEAVEMGQGAKLVPQMVDFLSEYLGKKPKN
jgi:2-hydroxy-3-oxopropionate reductase